MLTVTAAASSHDLITVAQAKAELGISGSSEDSLLTALVAQASAMITGWCGRDTFITETLVQTERLNEGQDCLVLARELGVAITSIVEDGETLAADDWERDGALLYRLDDDTRILWPPVKVVITYTAGFTVGSNVPTILQRAALDATVTLYRSRGRDVTIRSEQTEGVGETQYFDGRRADVPPIAADRLAALARYRRLTVA